MILNPTTRAIFWMLGAMFSLFGVGLMGKILSAHYDTFEIMFYRSAIAFPLFCVFIWLGGHFSTFRIRAFGLHFLRNINHFTAQNLWFYALASLPLAVVITFEFTTPAWVIIISSIFLGEGFGWRRALVIAFSLIGVLMITDPRHVEINGAVFAALACAIGFAITMILTKRLTRDQNVYEIIFMMTLMQGVFSALIIGVRMDLMPILPSQLGWMMAIAVLGTSSHYCMTRALALADASVVSPIDLIRLPISVFAGWLFFGETITLMMVVGALFLFIANDINIRRKTK